MRFAYVALLPLLLSPIALAQTPEMTPEMGAMQSRMAAAMTPGPAHKAIEAFVGEWDVTVKVWWGGPGSPAMTAKGKATTKSVLEGRFTMQELTYDMKIPGPNGLETKSVSSLHLLGYDNYRQQFVQTTMDSVSTHTLTFRGSSDPSYKVIRMYATMDEPGLNVVGRMVKAVTTIESPDKHRTEIYDLHPADDYKVLEFIYERAK